MLATISVWFGPELWLALSELAVATVVDLILTVALILTGRIDLPFQWRRLPQFLVTNLPYVVGVILGAALVRYLPELREEYLIATTGLAAWLARDWRAKWTVLMKFKGPETLKRAG